MSVGNAGRVVILLLAVGISIDSNAQSSSSLPIQPASQSTDTLLDVIPANVGAFVVFRNLAQLDTQYAGLLKSVGMSGSPLSMVKRSLGIVSGFDPNGAAAIVILPTDPSAGMSTDIAVLVPTINRKELLAFLSPEPANDDVTRALVRGKETYVHHRDGFTILAPSVAVVQRVIRSPRSVQNSLSEDQKRQISREGISIYFDIAAFLQTGIGRRLSDWLQEKAGIRAALDPLKSQLVSIRGDESGVSILASFRHDASAEGLQAAKPRTFLRGHLQESYGVAMDVAVSPAGLRERVGADVLLAIAVRAGLVRTDRADSIRSAARSVWGRTSGVSGSVAILASEAGSRMGLSIVLTCRNDAVSLRRAIEEFVQILKAGVFVDPGVNRFLQQLSWQRSAEVVADVPFDHVRFPLAGIPDVNQEKAAALFSREGIVIRLGTIDDRHVIITVGGGPDRTEAVVTNFKTGVAPLASDASIQRSGLDMPSDRRGECFVAVDRLVTIGCRLAEVFGRPCETPRIPAIDASIGLYALEASPTSTIYGATVPVALLIGLRDADGQDATKARVAPN